jgi:heme/copper-type cytochrome/quinol oxidase subunit 2
VMNVTVGQSVFIHVINNDTQAHGFQIVHYYDQGIGGTSGLAPGQCFNVSFTASQLGSFQVRCDIFCTIHAYMLSGMLNVNR